MKYEIKDFWAGVHFIGSSIVAALILAIGSPIVTPWIMAFGGGIFGVDIEVIKEITPYIVLLGEIIAALVILLIPVIYWVNSHAFIIENDKIRIPATDIENNFFDLITLKRIRGLYYWVTKPVNQVIDVKYDYGRDWNLQPYSGNSRKKQYKINIAFEDGSNHQVYFSNKQKRDAAVAILRKIRNKTKKANFGPDIAF